MLPCSFSARTSRMLSLGVCILAAAISCGHAEEPYAGAAALVDAPPELPVADVPPSPEASEVVRPMAEPAAAPEAGPTPELTPSQPDQAAAAPASAVPAPAEQPSAPSSQPAAAEPPPQTATPAPTTPTTPTPNTPVTNTPAPNGTPEFAWPADCEQRYVFRSYSGTRDTKYSVPAGRELHPQVMFEVPWTGEVQAVAFRSITDNARILHHWILYAPDGAFITGWAPGGDADKAPLPADVGVYLPSSGSLRLDMHYNNLTGTTAQEDASGVEACVIATPSKFRKNTAVVVGLIGNATVPAHARVDNVTTCTVFAPLGPATLISHSPHMHLLGTHAKLELTRDGVHSVLHDAPFIFDQQHNWPLAPAITVKTGDQFTVTCSYQNNTERLVTFGEDTGDEMCFNFVTVYPKGGFACFPF